MNAKFYKIEQKYSIIIRKKPTYFLFLGQNYGFCYIFNLFLNSIKNLFRKEIIDWCKKRDRARNST